jgi:OmcA/MtrC family decaheme c-type cytochrome
MSHAMELPYPMKMSNCATCHEGKLAAALDNDNFRPDVCKSCHVEQGIDAWPEDVGDTPAGLYAQPNRPPALAFLWARAGSAVVNVHNFPDINGVDCTVCHDGALAPDFAGYHTGYNDEIYNAAGEKYADLYTVTIDDVTLVDNLMTIDVSVSDALIAPEVLISFYGWDTKHFIVASHERDANRERMEYTFGSGGSALFTEADTGVDTTYSVTLDLSAYVPAKSTLDTIPNMVADGRIKTAEVTITPELTLADGTEVNLEAVAASFDVLEGVFPITDYFAGANAVVDIENCNACHDVLTSQSFHVGSGRGGTGMQVCKNCHVTTTRGSHLEMQSRGIDSYVHAIHAFQPFDEDDVFAADDPVFTARNEMHKEHAFPYFTSLACEGCHEPGTYEVPDQSESMPGVIGDSWEARNGVDYGRNIGEFPEAVTGAASRACGSCHRAEWIKEDHPGDLAAFNAHTGTFGTYVANDPDTDDSGDDPILWGIIDKIMSIF